ncbi:MAG: hypothetical protein NVSMB44_08410 [Ktedonobacteraceae bacterium]
MNVGGCKKDMDDRLFCQTDAFPGGIDIAGIRTREASDGRTAYKASEQKAETKK